MSAIAKVFIWVGTAAVVATANAIVPGMPRVIAGVDHITPIRLGEALSKFCNANDCVSRLVWDKDGAYAWNVNVKDATPVRVESNCIGIRHEYCVETWGTFGKEFMSSVQTQQLKQILEAEGAKVVSMDCQLHLGGHDVCADGKPPP